MTFELIGIHFNDLYEVQVIEIYIQSATKIQKNGIDNAGISFPDKIVGNIKSYIDFTTFKIFKRKVCLYIPFLGLKPMF